jgi:adenine C2-methylase RlmN of 23S rRNA A2503 and tRNA A37
MNSVPSSIVKQLVASDGSINLIFNYARSFIEARYVQRAPDYISAYVSSHNGCKMGCTFCWLTAQKQTEFNFRKHSRPRKSWYNNQNCRLVWY